MIIGLEGIDYWAGLHARVSALLSVILIVFGLMMTYLTTSHFLAVVANVNSGQPGGDKKDYYPVFGGVFLAWLGLRNIWRIYRRKKN